MDKAVPWAELDQRITELDKYQSDDYSMEATALIGDIKKNVLDGMDAYNQAVQSVYEWCDLATGSLNTYKTLLTGKIDEDKINAKLVVLLQEIKRGIEKTSVAQEALVDSSESLNVAAGKLARLNSQLLADFEDFQSQISSLQATPLWLHGLRSIVARVVERKLIPELEEEMTSTEKHLKVVTHEILNLFDETKAKLEDEIIHIEVLKGQVEATKSYIELDNMVEQKEVVSLSVSDLITKCNEYQMRQMNTE